MRFIGISSLLALSALASAQTSTAPLLVDSATAKQHLVGSPVEHIPPIAKLAHMFGEVQLQLWIDPSGHVSAVTVLSGAAMLQGAAIEDAQQWVYQPFLRDDQPVSATTVVHLNYTEGTPLPRVSSKPFPSKFSDAQIACVQALQQKNNLDKQVKSCGEAASLAKTLPAGLYTATAQNGAYLRASDVLLHNRQLKDGLLYAEANVALVESGFGDFDVACKAYATRAEIEANLAEYAASNRDFVKAEDFERIAIQSIQGAELKSHYTSFLKAVLGIHASVLTVSGDAAGAQARTQEASQL